MATVPNSLSRVTSGQIIVFVFEFEDEQTSFRVRQTRNPQDKNGDENHPRFEVPSHELKGPKKYACSLDLELHEIRQKMTAPTNDGATSLLQYPLRDKKHLKENSRNRNSIRVSAPAIIDYYKRKNKS